jgi:hypothetical protein
MESIRDMENEPSSRIPASCSRTDRTKSLHNPGEIKTFLGRCRLIADRAIDTDRLGQSRVPLCGCGTPDPAVACGGMDGARQRTVMTLAFAWRWRSEFVPYFPFFGCLPRWSWVRPSRVTRNPTQPASMLVTEIRDAFSSKQPNLTSKQGLSSYPPVFHLKHTRSDPNHGQLTPPWLDGHGSGPSRARRCT